MSTWKLARQIAYCCVTVLFVAAVGSLGGCATSSRTATSGNMAWAPTPPPSIGESPSSIAPAPPHIDELWVIEKSPAAAAAHHPQDDVPGSGVLLANTAKQSLVPLPLKHTDVQASVEGYIATVNVKQQYRNPYDEKIEAVYVFPLPQDAAVSEFVMTIGARHIRGIIREKKEAEKIYKEARAQGYVASLMTQQRPNIFTQSIANIEPGKQIDVNIKYVNALQYSDGWYEFVFPMVVGPRFNPPGSTTGVGAVAAGQRGASQQPTEVQYLRPDQRSGNDVSLSLDIDAGVAVDQIESRNHKVSSERDAESGRTLISLNPHDAIPNKDFVLRYKVAGGTIKSAAVAHKDSKVDKDGGYFSLMLLPPETLASLPRQPLEMVFTIDVSGSQSGAPLAQEKAATKYCLTHMNAEDRFQVIRFGNTAQTIFPTAVPADERHVLPAIQWVDALDAVEGTMLVDGLRASLLFPHDESRLRFVTFLTDGFIGNESQALAELHNDLGPARVFSFGVGSSTNRFLLDHMAKMGNGAAAYLGLNDKAEDVMADYFSRISHPALTDISVDWGSWNVSEVLPERLPDLFVGRPVVLSGKFHGPAPKEITIHGRVGGENQSIVVPIAVKDSPGDALPLIWARAKIADLADRATWSQNAQLSQQVRQVALEYGLLSEYTAFVAVDALTKTAGDHGTTVQVPVVVPDGVRYQTTVIGAKD